MVFQAIKNITLASMFFSLIVFTYSSQLAAEEVCGSADFPCTIESGTFHIRLPEGEVRGAILLLHGGGGHGRDLLNSNMAKQALKRGFVFVAPNGEHPTARFPNNWAVKADNFGHEKDDITFLKDVMDHVSQNYSVDRNKILLTGFSRGGSMVWDVACQAPNSARAYAPAAGAFWDTLPTKCQGPVSLFHTHGWDDRTVPLEGRPLWDGKIAQGDVWQSIRILRETNGCEGRQPSRSTVEDGRWLKHWGNCKAGRIDLMLYPGGHGVPDDWAKRTLDWFEARLVEDRS